MSVVNKAKTFLQNSYVNIWLDDGQETQKEIFSFLNRKDILSSIMSAEKSEKLSATTFLGNIYKKIESRNKKYATSYNN